MGQRHGARSRSPGACRSTSRMIAAMRISHEAIYQRIVRPRPRSVAPRTDGLLANQDERCGCRGRETQPRQRLCLAGDHDQQAPGRSSRSGGARTLGRRPHPGPWQLGDRHARRAHTRFTMLLHLPRLVGSSVTRHAPRTGLRSLAMVPRPCATLSRAPSSPCRNSYAGRSPGIKEPRWPSMRD